MRLITITITIPIPTTTAIPISIPVPNPIAITIPSLSSSALYETDVPLAFRAIVKLGAYCRVASPNLSDRRFLRDGGNLDDLEMVLGCDTETPYLHDIDLKPVFLYSAGTDQRSIVVLVTPTYAAITIAITIAIAITITITITITIPRQLQR